VADGDHLSPIEQILGNFAPPVSGEQLKFSTPAKDLSTMDSLTFSGLPARQLSRSEISAFSLVEVTFALGVASFCLVAVLGLLPTALKTQQLGAQQTIANGVMTEILSDLRADVRVPPGQASKEQNSGLGLHGHWA
jgi:hypothetical protein